MSRAVQTALWWLLRTFRPILRLGPKLPMPRLRQTVWVTRFADVREVLDRPDVFRVRRFGARMRASAGEFLLGLDDGAQRELERNAARAALGALSPDRVRETARHATQEAIEELRKSGCDHFDLLADVTARVAPRVIETDFGLLDPGAGTLLEWVQLLSWFVFNPFANEADRAAGIRAGKELRAHTDRVVAARAAGQIGGGATLLDHLLASLEGQPDPTARTLIGLVAGTLGPPPLLFAQALERLLDLRGAHRRELFDAARRGDHVQVERFVLEAARFAPAPGLIYRTCHHGTVLAEGRRRATRVAAGDLVLCSVTSALRDGRRVSRPRRFWPERPPEQRLLFGHGIHECIGRDLGVAMLVGMAEPIFALPGLRRVRGRDGRLRKGPRGAFPAQHYPQHLIARFDLEGAPGSAP